MTHSQKQIWVGQTLNPESPLYNMAFAFGFSTDLRVDLFQRAWNRVVRESDALRTVVVERDGLGTRRVREPARHRTEILDFAQRPDPELAFRRWCHERSAVPLRLDEDLVDSVLVKLGETRTAWYLNQHHLIADAWSTVLVYCQVAAEYQALLTGQAGPPSLDPYYPTAAGLEASETARIAALDSWKNRVQQRDGTTPLYGHDCRPMSTPSHRLTLMLDDDQSRTFDQLCCRPEFLSLSPDMSRFAAIATLLAAWLHRISGRHELGFDAPVAGRPTAAAKRSIGLFVEMFPFSVRVEPQDSFLSLGAKCRAEAQRFLRHALPGTSAPSGTTASNVVLNYFPGLFGDFAGLPTDVEWIHPGHGDSVHAMRLQVHDFGGTGRYTLHFDFNDGVLPQELRRRSLEHFSSLLEGFLEDPDRQIASIDLSTPEERRVLAELNATSTTPLPEATVVALIDAQAGAMPDRPALREGSREISFARLKQDSEALAVTLVEHGIEPGDRVALITKRSTLAVIAILATLRARAAYVPIDPSYPDSRIRQILLDSGARMVLLDDEPSAPAPNPDVAAVTIDDGVRIGRGRSLDRPGPGLNDLAYLLYTSGSTGRPKGVLIEHRGLVDYLQWASNRYVRGDRLTFPLFTSLSFDLTVTSLFLPLITGGTMEIYPQAEGPVDSALIDVLEANTADFIKLTPSHLSLLRQVDLERSRIRRIVVGGEDFRTPLAAAIHAKFGHQVEIHNEYGPTEAVVGCIAHQYDAESDTASRVPIGRPADHVQVQILNDALTPVPLGVPGELWISRFGLARGYHGLARLTEERFSSPTPRSDAIFYRTGDLVRIATPGAIEYLGRLDRQLKVSGYRIEPGEIEAAMLTFPGIERSVVIGRELHNLRSRAPRESFYCARCGLPSNYPGVTFDETEVCSVCQTFDSIAEKAHSYFKTMDDLRELFQQAKRTNDSEYDCLLLLSGGKDSTYALCQLVDLGLSVYAFTLDNGFISDSAKTNMSRVTEHLGVPLEFGSTPPMNAIFRDSLERFSNVCNGCFKTIYTLSTQRARELGIPTIVTGLSRGQMFETRLTGEMFREGRFTPEEVDAAVLAARKVYHRVDDEVSRSLDVQIFQEDRLFEEIRFVDFYRYCDVGLQEVLSYLERRKIWVRPADTGRSTNCLINDTGIFIHQKERGFHNYALPYSWDVRLGHKNREDALDELHDELDVENIRQILEEIDYDEHRLSRIGEDRELAAFFVASEEVSLPSLRAHLGKLLPSHLQPSALQQVESIPLTANAKVDETALAQTDDRAATNTVFTPPEGPVEEYLATLWQQRLGVERVGSQHDFFDLGGTSLGAMDVMIRLCEEFHIDLPLETLFNHSTIRALATVAEERILEDVAGLSATDPPTQGAQDKRTS